MHRLSNDPLKHLRENSFNSLPNSNSVTLADITNHTHSLPISPHSASADLAVGVDLKQLSRCQCRRSLQLFLIRDLSTADEKLCLPLSVKQRMVEPSNQQPLQPLGLCILRGLKDAKSVPVTGSQGADQRSISVSPDSCIFP